MTYRIFDSNFEEFMKLGFYLQVSKSVDWFANVSGWRKTSFLKLTSTSQLGQNVLDFNEIAREVEI